MSDNILTNEWVNADLCKPWRNRIVLVHFEDDGVGLAIYNGMYWTDIHCRSRLDRVRRITHFYIFERFNEKNEL